MQFPITIGLHRSLFLGAGLAVAHAIAAAAILIPDWRFGIKAILWAGVAASAVTAWRSWVPKVQALRLRDPGRIECRLDGAADFLPAELLPGATVYPWLTVFRLKAGDRRLFAVVLPDSATAEDFRRLRLWLRWRAESSAGANAV